MDETNTGAQGAPQTSGQPSGDGAGSTSTPAVTTYTEAEYKSAVEKAVSDALAKAGREKKAIEDENATLKSRVSSFDANLAEIQEDRAKLKATLEELGKDDPDKAKIVQKIKDLDEQSKVFKSERAKLEAERAEHAEMVKAAVDTNMEMAVFEIATDYENGDAEKLMAAVKKLGIGDEAKIRDVADTFWTKATRAQTPPVAGRPDSGITSGGGVDLDKLTPLEKITYGLAHAKAKK